MFLSYLSCGPFGTNCYLVACEITKKAAIFDVPFDSLSWILSEISTHQFIPEAIYLTHSHWDHIGDLKLLQNSFDLSTYVHSKDAANVIKPGSDGLPMIYPVKPASITDYLAEGLHYQIGNLSFSVFETPGHSEGSVVFHFSNEHLLISGDTLFKGTCGRVDLPTSDPSKMLISLKKLSLLPDQTKVYPGHGKPTTIKNEKAWIERPEEFL